MEKEIFEKFMELRFPHIKETNYYYSEWKQRFEYNPVPYMDSESLRALKLVLHNLYIKQIKKELRGK